MARWSERGVLLVEGEQIDAELNAAGEELQVRTAELACLKEDEKAHQSELDALKASAAKTRRHLADRNARAVEEEKKEKRRLVDGSRAGLGRQRWLGLPGVGDRLPHARTVGVAPVTIRQGDDSQRRA
ncbi:hypothetical protein SDC9_38967 [bioreactor metagenome]|uniref:Uncharacterized protein n=1 Tax=bioreactor metagenome TaxID=1076179 RepID=A0A644VNF0_9ZZZZ